MDEDEVMRFVYQFPSPLEVDRYLYLTTWIVDEDEIFMVSVPSRGR